MVRDRRPYDFPDADVVFSLLRNGCRVAEVPARMYFDETGGQLHRGLAPVRYMFEVIVSLFVSRLRRLEGRGAHGRELSMKVSDFSLRIENLTREVALLRNELSDRRGRSAGDRGAEIRDEGA